MTAKEELFAQGWEVIFSGSCNVEAWGKWIIVLCQDNKRVVHGYGTDEDAALAQALETATKIPVVEVKER